MWKWELLHAYDSSNHKQSAKITCRILASHARCKNHTRACGIAASKNPTGFFCWSYVNLSWCLVLKSHVSCWYSTRACVNHTRAFRNHTRECHSWTHTCQNHTLRVEITVVRVENKFVSVVIPFMRVKFIMRVKITLFV
jgi:hypothetical protein